MSQKFKEKCIGVLLGTAVGDILGAGIEGVPRIAILRDYGEVRDYMIKLGTQLAGIIIKD